MVPVFLFIRQRFVRHHNALVVAGDGFLEFLKGQFLAVGHTPKTLEHNQPLAARFQFAGFDLVLEILLPIEWTLEEVAVKADIQHRVVREATHDGDRPANHHHIHLFPGFHGHWSAVTVHRLDGLSAELVAVMHE